MCHVDGGPGLIDEDEPFEFKIDLAVEPGVALPQDVGPVLLDRVLFLLAVPFGTARHLKASFPDRPMCWLVAAMPG
jgi:hypothetical protein